MSLPPHSFSIHQVIPFFIIGVYIDVLRASNSEHFTSVNGDLRAVVVCSQALPYEVITGSQLTIAWELCTISVCPALNMTWPLNDHGINVYKISSEYNNIHNLSCPKKNS